MEPESSFPRLQVPNTCPYPAPDRPSPCPNTPTSWRSFLILSSLPCLSLPRGLFLQASPPQPCMHLSSSHPYYMPAHPIILHLITRIILDEDYRSLSSSLCSFLHSPVSSSLLDPSILLSTLFSNSLRLRFPSMWATMFHTHTNYSSV